MPSKMAFFCILLALILRFFFLIYFSGWVSWVGLWSQLNILMFFFFLFIYWTKLISLKKNHVGFLFYWFFFAGFGATMGRKFWFLWMPTMKDLCNLCLLESYAQQLICKQTFCFVFCFVNKQLKSSDCISAAACMMWLFWFGLQLLFVFWTVEFCQFLHDFFVHNSHRIVPPYHKILHNYWLLVLLCI